MKVVRPEGLEPPAYWFEAGTPRRINNLAVGTTAALDFRLLLVLKQFRYPTDGALATLHNAAMYGVGTVLGTVDMETGRVTKPSEILPGTSRNNC